jgi:hypothetical protein
MEGCGRWKNSVVKYDRIFSAMRVAHKSAEKVMEAGGQLWNNSGVKYDSIFSAMKMAHKSAELWKVDMY